MGYIQFLHTCGKQAYLRKEEAEVIKLQMRKTIDKNKCLRVYHCELCGLYHIGRKPKKPPKSQNFLDVRSKKGPKRL